MMRKGTAKHPNKLLGLTEDYRSRAFSPGTELFYRSHPTADPLITFKSRQQNRCRGDV